ncbi:MAG: hypothetical protein GY948_23670, partial [Alphaproteobacteria bacterium]|nr:hypothetical protein [Alphaproteobacteria bacterium]
MMGSAAPLQLVEGFWVNDAVTGCAIWSADPPEMGEAATWTGSCSGGKADGRGNLLFWDNDGVLARYNGEMMDGRVHGAGTMAFRSED